MTQILSADKMRDFGVKVGELMTGGEVIELVGDVGTGKTTFVRGLAIGLAVDEQVQSPSFTINRLYDARDGLQLVHYDFYRLGDPGIMRSELDEMLHDKNAVVVVEWADAVSEVLPQDRLTFRIVPDGEHSRTVTFAAGGPTSQMKLEEIHDSLA
jgi:tRNA threonylcarbamoyladenosine biosynthesis protein TsaE